MMKPNCCFMNIGRGNSVVENDLVKALEEKVISSAVLDVFEPEPLPQNSKLWGMNNVFITPHSADNVEGLVTYSMGVWKEHFDCYVEGKPLRNVVNIELGY